MCLPWYILLTWTEFADVMSAVYVRCCGIVIKTSHVCVSVVVNGCMYLLCSIEVSSQLQSMMQSHCSEALQLLQLANTASSSAAVSLVYIYPPSDAVQIESL